MIAVECMKKYGGGLPVALTLRAGPTGDFNDVSLQECAVMLKKAGHKSLAAVVVATEVQKSPN